MFFEHNLPENAPIWLDASVMVKFNDTMAKIRGRMELLETSLEVTGMTGETFSKYAKKLFDMDPERIDSLTPEDIASFVFMMNDGKEAEPRMEWSNAITVVDTAFLTTKEWESVRHIGIGGSEAAVVLGVSPYQTASGLYHAKVGTPEVKKADDHQWVFDRGHVMEPYVIDAFCHLTGAKVIPETRMFASRTYPNCTANIDAIIRFDDGRMFVFEAKTTIKANWAAWSCDQIPGHYVPQMRQYPAVLDDDRILGTYIGCCFTDDTVVGGMYAGSQFDGKKFVARYIEREKTIEEEQLKAEEEWFHDYIEANTVPPMEGNPKAEEQVIQTYLQGPKEAPQKWGRQEVESDIQQWMKIRQEHSEAQKRVKALDKDAKSVSVRLIEKLGASTEATVDLGDGTCYQVKNSPRARMSVNTEDLDTLLDVAAPHLPQELVSKLRACIVKDEDSYRVFSIKEKKVV